MTVQAKMFVSDSLLHNKLGFAKKLLHVGAFDSDFGNRKHDLIQERRRIKSNQFYKKT